MKTVNEVSKLTGVRKLDFTVFDSSKLDEYSKKAKEQWGDTPAYKEYEEKSKKWTKGYEKNLMANLAEIFKEFGTMKDMAPESDEVQIQVKKLQDFITENFYTCTDDILYGLGTGYAAGGEMTENIEKMGGEGTAEFVFNAIKIHCGK